MPGNNTEQRRLAAIMFTDMVGYSALAQRDEALALELLEGHRALVRRVLPIHSGTEVKTTGDGFLIEFPSALAAVQCAVQIQKTQTEFNQTQPAERKVLMRIGIHLGDVIRRENDVFGDGVNIAARIEPLASPGGICLTRAVFEQIENKVPHKLIQLNRPDLKNISANVEVYRLVLENSEIEPHPANRAKSILSLTVVFVVVLNALLFLKFGLRESSNRNSPPERSNTTFAVSITNLDQKSIAVLPFMNLSNDKNNEYFSDGISEELLNALAKVPGLKVSARTSAFHFKGKNIPVPEIAQQLGVAYIVEGSVRKSDTRVRITAQLIKAADGFHLWSDTFTRDIKDIFAAQEEIAGLIAEHLSLKMGVGSGMNNTVDPEAAQLYFEARQLWNVRSEAALNRMETLLTHALELDPSFGPAEAGLAQVWIIRAFVRVAAARDVEHELTNVVKHATKAIELNPTSAEAFEALGSAALVRGDLSAAELALTRSVALNANYAPGWNKYGWLLLRRGMLGMALEQFARAQELDPLVWSMIDGYGWSLMQNRQYARALEAFQRSRTSTVNAPVTWANGGIALMLAGKNEEARRVVEHVIQRSVQGEWNPGLWDWSEGLTAWVLAETGKGDEAKRITQRLLAGPDAHRFPAGFALVALGREEEGFDVLTGLPQQVVSYLWLLVQKHATLATNPKFQQLLERLQAKDAFQTVQAAWANPRKPTVTQSNPK